MCVCWIRKTEGLQHFDQHVFTLCSSQHAVGSQQYWGGLSIFLVTLYTLTPHCKTCACALLGVCVCVCVVELLYAAAPDWSAGSKQQQLEKWTECFKEESIYTLSSRPQKQNVSQYFSISSRLSLTILLISRSLTSCGGEST